MSNADLLVLLSSGEIDLSEYLKLYNDDDFNKGDD